MQAESSKALEGAVDSGPVSRRADSRITLPSLGNVAWPTLSPEGAVTTKADALGCLNLMHVYKIQSTKGVVDGRETGYDIE